MVYEVVGFRKCSGKSKNTGKDYSGFFVYLTYEQEGVTGKATENVFIADSLGYDPYNGDRIQLNYNARGFLMEVRTV